MGCAYHPSMNNAPVSKGSARTVPSAQGAQVGTHTLDVQGLMIVDDHELVRWGLRVLIQSQPGLTNHSVQIFEASTLAGALATVAAHQADIRLVFFDLGLPDAQGLVGLARFREQCPTAQVVVLSGDSSTQTAEAAMALGAQAYLKKSGDLAEVIDYLQHLGLMGPHGALGGATCALPGPRNKAKKLTARQTKILQWMLQGKSNREIGELAFLAEGTVKNHVSTLLLHFGARSRAQLISALR